MLRSARLVQVPPSVLRMPHNHARTARDLSRSNNFDKLALLSAGKPCYVGPISEEQPARFYREAGFEYPPQTNIADFIIETLAFHPDAQEKLTSLLRSRSQVSSVASIGASPPPIDTAKLAAIGRRSQVAEVVHFREQLLRCEEARDSNPTPEWPLGDTAESACRCTALRCRRRG